MITVKLDDDDPWDAWLRLALDLVGDVNPKDIEKLTPAAEEMNYLHTQLNRNKEIS